MLLSQLSPGARERETVFQSQDEHLVSVCLFVEIESKQMIGESMGKRSLDEMMTNEDEKTADLMVSYSRSSPNTDAS